MTARQEGESAGSDGSADTMRGRVPGSRVRVWLLLEADRLVITGVILGLVFLALGALAWVVPGRFEAALAARDPVETLFQAMVTAIVTGVTLVVSINQLVLSQELGPVGDQYSRIQGAMAFRRDVEDRLDEPVSPSDPAEFLQSLLGTVQDDARRVERIVRSGGGGTHAEEIAAFSDEVSTNAAAVSRRFEGAAFGTFDVVSAALDFNYSAKIYEGRKLRTEYADDLSEEGEAAIDALVETLVLFGPAREHFKTLYFQWALIDLSRAVLYAAVPALATAAAMILFFDDPGVVPGATAGVDNAYWLVSLALVVTVSPFVLLLSYILRIATVAKRTLAIGPFVLRGDDG